MTFQEFIQHIESRIGDSINSIYWSVTLLGIVERRPKSIKVNLRFTKNDFFFDKEIKLVEQHFDGVTKFVNEIQRQLNRLDRYIDAISELSIIAPLPTITNTWKGRLSAIKQVSPIHAIVTFSFFRNFSGEPVFIDIDLNIYADSFLNKKVYTDWLTEQVAILNSPIDISYYKNLIKLI